MPFGKPFSMLSNSIILSLDVANTHSTAIVFNALFPFTYKLIDAPIRIVYFYLLMKMEDAGGVQ